jgi:hypothetical protein
MNDLHFVTDRNGKAVYKHVEKKDYTIDFAETSIKGLSPRSGVQQTFESRKDTDMVVLFAKMRVVSGHVDIIQDQKAESKFFTANIKVMAIDAAGNSYSALTDKDGNYFLNLPVGKYEVMLNKDAFNRDYFPERLSFNADLTQNKMLQINFLIKQKQRQMRMLNAEQKEVDVKLPEKEKEPFKQKGSKKKTTGKAN